LQNPDDFRHTLKHWYSDRNLYRIVTSEHRVWRIRSSTRCFSKSRPARIRSTLTSRQKKGKHGSQATALTSTSNNQFVERTTLEDESCPCS
jgi:hypothetical protein